MRVALAIRKDIRVVGGNVNCNHGLKFPFVKVRRHENEFPLRGAFFRHHLPANHVLPSQLKERQAYDCSDLDYIGGRRTRTSAHSHACFFWFASASSDLVANRNSFDSFFLAEKGGPKCHREKGAIRENRRSCRGHERRYFEIGS